MRAPESSRRPARPFVPHRLEYAVTLVRRYSCALPVRLFVTEDDQEFISPLCFRAITVSWMGGRCCENKVNVCYCVPEVALSPDLRLPVQVPAWLPSGSEARRLPYAPQDRGELLPESNKIVGMLLVTKQAVGKELFLGLWPVLIAFHGSSLWEH